ncbi:MAG TPA: DUF6084 family protein [Thermoanaerobaculia bacterium]|jgi:hypothetical protein|nr:DUF6084 family protein [Thermoanaerobaculia bacterium]
MTNLSFTVLGARAEPYAAVPTLIFRLGIAESTGERIHALALRCQIQIEPRHRHYTGHEEERLLELFGEPRRWGETLKSILWTHASTMLPGFTGSLEFDLPVACTYDFEVTGAKYFHALDDGEIPLLLLFNGTVFTRGQTGFSVEPVPWEKEAPFRLPVKIWRELMDQYFPGGAWIRLRRESFDALHRFKGRRALPTWDDAVEALIREAGEEPS